MSQKKKPSVWLTSIWANIGPPEDQTRVLQIWPRGRAITQAVSRQLPTYVAQVRAQVR
jgi:hypothetical protein